MSSCASACELTDAATKYAGDDYKKWRTDFIALCSLEGVAPSEKIATHVIDFAYGNQKFLEAPAEGKTLTEACCILAAFADFEAEIPKRVRAFLDSDAGRKLYAIVKKLLDAKPVTATP
jgi:hypothetical protein